MSQPELRRSDESLGVNPDAADPDGVDSVDEPADSTDESDDD